MNSSNLHTGTDIDLDVIGIIRFSRKQQAGKFEIDIRTGKSSHSYDRYFNPCNRRDDDECINLPYWLTPTVAINGSQQTEHDWNLPSPRSGKTYATPVVLSANLNSVKGKIPINVVFENGDTLRQLLKRCHRRLAYLKFRLLYTRDAFKDIFESDGSSSFWSPYQSYMTLDPSLRN